MSQETISSSSPRFGTVSGVLIPNITMMFGVILFLRLGVITAHAGMMTMLMVIGLSLLIMILTSLSIGSLVTNMRVGHGGVYYIISRSLGLEMGGAVGLALYFAQLISISLTISGFAISLHDLLPSVSVSLIEITSLLLLALLSGVSSSWALKVQGLILALLLVAIASIFFGSPENVSAGNLVEPFYSGGKLGFFAAFALFYPAMTGIEAGMALSGSLKDPAKSLFYGNLLSLVFVGAIYAALSVFAYIYVPIDVLISDPFALVDFSISPSLVRVAVWGATLSSALGSLLGAPRMLQAMASDKIVFSFLAKTTAKRNEPFWAMIVTTVLTAVIIFFTTIDQIIPMLAMICLVSYGLLNFLSFFSQLINSPSWRPSLRTPWWISIAAFLLIFIIMILIEPAWTLVTIFLLLGIYILIRMKDVESGFSDLRESFIFFLSRLMLYRLVSPTEHALTWHPQILTLIGSPQTAKNLVRISHSLTRRSGILTFATVVPEDWQDPSVINSKREALVSYFDRKRISCLCEVYPAESINHGYTQLIKAFGIGPIQPNTVSIAIDQDSLDDSLLDIIDTCKMTQKNIMLFRDADAISESFIIRRKMGQKKKIDVWWDASDTKSFHMTMSLVTTLTDGLSFNNALVTIKCYAGDTNAQGEIERYLSDYLVRSRLEAKVKVFEPKQKDAEPAHLGFYTLSSIGDDREEYINHIKNKVFNMPKNQIGILVTSYDTVEHKEIYGVNDISDGGV